MRIKTNVASKGFFPAGYKLVTTGVFPGFDKLKRIPISFSSYNTGYSANNKNTGTAGTVYFDGYPSMTFASASASAVAQSNMNCSMTVPAVDLMGLCKYNFDKMKNVTSISGGTVIAWLEKGAN